MSRVTARLFAIALVAALAGCSKGASISPVPAAAAGSMTAKASNGALLYVADLNKNAVYVYTYPAGGLVGQLTGLSRPHGECTDAAGDVYVTNGLDQDILEYAHGGTTPIATLADPTMFPSACAIDPVTGNLAVVHSPLSTGPATVAIYVHAGGTPQPLPHSPVFDSYYLAYDAHGNIWVDGMNRKRKWFRFAEFLSAKQQWQRITFDHAIGLPGGVQWVGNTLVVGDQVNLDGPSVVAEFSMNGNTGKLLGFTPLKNSCNVLQFQVVGKTVVAPNTCKPAVLYFDFPKGGRSTKAIRWQLSQPVGVVVSR